MARLKSYILGGVTLTCALAIGYILQYGFGLPTGDQAELNAPIEVSDIELTSSGLGAPRLPLDGISENALPQQPVVLAAASPITEVEPELPSEAAETGFDCQIDMSAEVSAGAMVRITLTAPCHASERVTIHHQGMMFTEVMQPDGSLKVTVPALAERASFIASFASGSGATTSTEVTSMPFYDRVAVQWKGQTGLQLHARENGADYFSSGHIWSAASGDLGKAAAGEGGFLVRLGQETAPDAQIVEVYSFPSGTAKQDGNVILSVEAEITEANCNKQIEAQTMELHADGQLRVGDLTLEMPECDSVGDFLVLKNIVEDLKVASR